jgi:hypothetical protein
LIGLDVVGSGVGKELKALAKPGQILGPGMSLT